MKLKYQMETMLLEDRTIAVPVGEQAQEFHGIVKLNDIGAEILDMLHNDVTEDEIVRAIEKEYDISYETLTKDIHTFLLELSDKGLLER